MTHMKTLLLGLLGGVLGSCVVLSVVYFAWVSPMDPVATSGEVRATSFTMVGDNWKELATLKPTPGGSQLMMYDAFGSPRIALGVEGDKAMLALFGDDHKSGVGLRTSSQGSLMALIDRAGVVRLGAGLIGAGPWVALHDEAGEKFWSTPTR